MVEINYHGEFVLSSRKLFQEIAAIDGSVEDDLFQTDGNRLSGQVQLFQRCSQLEEFSRKEGKQWSTYLIQYTKLKWKTNYLEGLKLTGDELGPNGLWHSLVGRQPIVMEMRPCSNHFVKVHAEEWSHLVDQMK